MHAVQGGVYATQENVCGTKNYATQWNIRGTKERTRHRESVGYKRMQMTQKKLRPEKTDLFAAHQKEGGQFNYVVFICTYRTALLERFGFIQ